jgi:hypothetical protein
VVQHQAAPGLRPGANGESGFWATRRLYTTPELLRRR